MTTKADYTEEEWQQLLRAPVLTGTYIMAADVSLTAVGKEMKAMLQAMQAPDVPAGAQDLVSSLMTDILAKSSNKEKMEQPEIDKGADALPQLLESIISATAVLDEKSTPEEKAGFNEWLMKIASATAEAGKEGGFLGIGAVRVSNKEKAALERLAVALG